MLLSKVPGAGYHPVGSRVLAEKELFPSFPGLVRRTPLELWNPKESPPRNRLYTERINHKSFPFTLDIDTHCLKFHGKGEV